MHAVLTADIVNSTKLERSTERKLFNALQNLLKPYLFEFYRGDSFQVYIKEPAISLRVALLCRTIAISLTQDQSRFSDIRVSLGIGKVSTPVRTLGSAKGEAFILSGREFDKIAQTEIRLSIVTVNPAINTGFQVISDYLNSIYRGMTPKQAAVIFELLTGKTQQEVATDLKKSKSTIHQLVTAGKWPEVQRLLKQFENLTNQLT